MPVSHTLAAPVAGITSCLWYRVVLSAEQVGAGAVVSIRERFAARIDAAGEPDGACLFVSAQPAPSDLDVLRGTDETVSVFFSPVSLAFVQALIALYDGRPSPPPNRVDAALLAGHLADWNLLPRVIH